MSEPSEAEIQLLIALLELAEPKETPNNTHYTFYPHTLAEAAAYFREFKADWAPAWKSLARGGLLQGTGETARLTPAGLEAARAWREARPPIYYWYRQYYALAPHSPAYSRFCTRLYGLDLCQTNFSDLEQLNLLCGALALTPADRALDLGCGAGHIAEFLSAQTGAHFDGLDYCPEAIAQALARTRERRERLNFHLGNLDHLPFPPASFDALTSVDTLYMPNDLPATLRQMRALLVPGGRMGIFYTHMEGGPDRDGLAPERTPLAQALQADGLLYRTWDVTAPTYALMQRKHRLAQAMRPEFEAEGALFLYEHVAAESIASPEPYDPAECSFRRYLFLARV